VLGWVTSDTEWTVGTEGIIFLPYEDQNFMSLESASGFIYWPDCLRLS